MMTRLHGRFLSVRGLIRQPACALRKTASRFAPRIVYDYIAGCCGLHIIRHAIDAEEDTRYDLIAEGDELTAELARRETRLPIPENFPASGVNGAEIHHRHQCQHYCDYESAAGQVMAAFF
jgi:hypothetical protein